MPQLIAALSHQQPPEPDAHRRQLLWPEAQETSGTCRSMADGKNIVLQLQHVGSGCQEHIWMETSKGDLQGKPGD